MVKNSITVLDKVTSLPVTPVSAAGDSFRMLVDAYANYKQIAEVEKTKRTGINAWRDTKVLELNNQREILQLYLKETFKERAMIIQGSFDALDKGIASGNDHLIEQSLGAILTIAKQSPLAEARSLIADMHDPNIKEIEI